MLRNLGPALLVVVGLFCGSAASASPLTFYTDEAAWLAAVSGFKVGTYPFNVTYSDTLVNVALIPNIPGGSCCVISTPPPIGEYAPVLGPNFTSVDITFSSQGLDVNCFFPSFCTFATDVEVNFPTPIYGFASNAFVVAEDNIISIVDQGGEGGEVPLATDLFFGVTGLINSLDFESSTNPIYDQNVQLELSGIVVATVDEPSGSASLATGLVLLVVALSSFRRRAGRGYRWQR